jgi:chromosome partitioning protein
MGPLRDGAFQPRTLSYGEDNDIIDLDPQGSASFSLGITEKDARPSAADLLLNDKPIREVIRETGRPGLDLVTGSMELAEGDLTLARKRDPERQLARALAPVRRRYDFIIVDCPPGLSVLSLNGLAASTPFTAIHNCWASC